jgi:Arc/MetJ-type ribon-helix-helix transcriptional regulator
MRTTKTISISLAPEQLKKAERLTRKQNRTMSELFREGLRRLEQDEKQEPLSELATVLRLVRQAAKSAGLDNMTRREITAEVEAARQERVAKAGHSKRR